MASVARQAVAPLYLLMCLTLGGSPEAVWASMLLQVAGIAIIAWAAATHHREPLGSAARQLLLLALVTLASVAVQLAPLPASVWPHLGGRREIADGYRILGLAIPAAPLSVTPYETLVTLVRAVPALAMFCAVVVLRAYRRSWLVLALLLGTLSGILLGVLQVASPDRLASPWYLYAHPPQGLATGFFANPNHMAILLVLTLPFLAALLASARGRKVQYLSGMIAAVVGAALVIVVGAVLTRSGAGYIVALPVLAASILIAVPVRGRVRRWIAGAAVVLLAAAAAALVFSPVGDRTLNSASSAESRVEFYATTVEAIGDFLPFGSGLGSFRAVYKLYEDDARVTPVIVNHAHNDYLELALELGIAGIVLMALFLAWWAAALRRVWRFSDAGPYARAASIASAALLVHSLVDFPLRTAALSVVFAMCLGLLAARHRSRAPDESELWPTRHVVLR